MQKLLASTAASQARLGLLPKAMPTLAPEGPLRAPGQIRACVRRCRAPQLRCSNVLRAGAFLAQPRERSVFQVPDHGTAASKSLDDSVVLVRRYVEALNTGDLDALDELFADDFVIHQPSGDRRGKAAIRAFVASVQRLLPDIHARIDAICADDAFADGHHVGILLTHSCPCASSPRSEVSVGVGVVIYVSGCAVWSRVSTWARVGSAGIAPYCVVVIAPTALAKRSAGTSNASSDAAVRSRWAERPARRPATKASPAPRLSTDSTGIPATWPDAVTVW